MLKRYTLLLDGKKTGISYVWDQEGITKEIALKEIAGRMNMFDDLKGFSVKISDYKGKKNN